MPPSEFLKSKIESIRAELQKLERERARLHGQLEAYQDIMQSGVSLDNIPAATQAGHLNSGKRNRGLSEQWKITIRRLACMDTFDYDSIAREAKRAGIEAEIQTIRGRMSKYTENGYVERISDGLYRVTQKGKEAAT
jgi:hypothetical protein